MNVNPMKIPYTRREIERRFNLLEVAIRNNKMIFSSECMGVTNSLSKVMRMENGRLDLLTVDEAARLQANMMVNVLEEDDMSDF